MRRGARPGMETYYPMEVCVVLDNQRVKGEQQTAQQIQVKWNSN